MAPPELGTGEPNTVFLPKRAFSTRAHASREAKVTVSPQREHTDPHDPRSLCTKFFCEVTPHEPEGGAKAC